MGWDDASVAKWFRSVHPDQGALLPAGMRSWLPPGHLAWQVPGAVGELDMSGFTAAYRADGQGQAPYDPAMMLALVLYCFFKGTRSSRKIAAACIDDVGCRVICGGAAPGHQAVAHFLRRHRAEVRRLFVQVLGLLAAAGAIEGHCAAIDGSPVSGNASRFGNLDQDQLAARIAALEAAIGAAAEAWLAGADAADGAGSGQLPFDDDDDDDDDDGPGGGPGGGVPRRLTAMAATLARLHAAQDKLAERRQAASPRSPDARITAARDAIGNAARRLAAAEDAQAAVMEKYQAAVAAGKAWAGTKPVPAAENVRIARIRKNLATAQGRLAAAEARAAATGPAKVSATDPDSRLLPAKNGGGYLQGWNLELAAARRQVLLAIELHDSPADCGALITMIEAAAANCELAGVREQIRAWLADNGYASAANFAALEHLMLLVAVTGEATQTGRGTGGRPLPAGWEKMAARLATPAGKKLYKRRAGLVEPAFAQLFARFGRYLNYRGHDAADAEIKLLGAVHNLAKLFEYRRRHPPAAPA
jgi:transposase